ncbi:MAG: sulfite exporter TauE/SafE family protein [Thioalkalivibrio sp.]|nr:sulfite exporter TauE/SafE family protein [Thioalkalivibrio sp.]
MSLAAVAIACGAVFAGAVLTGTTGFGFALLAVPLLLWILPPSSVVFVVTILGTITSGAIALQARGAIDWRAARWLIACATVGLWLGSTLLVVLPPTVLETIANLAVVVFALLLTRRPTKVVSLSVPLLALAGVATGTLTTSVGMGGPPTVLAFAYAGVAKDSMRSTVSAFFAVNGVLGIALLLARGLVEGQDALLALALIAPAALGTAIGTHLSRRLSQRSYRRLALGILLVTGATGLVSVLLQ